MGYDVRLYLGDEWSASTLPYNLPQGDFYSFEDVGMIELCKVDDELHGFMTTMPKSKFFVWGDGEEDSYKILDDNYGDFKMITGENVKKFLNLLRMLYAKSFEDGYDTGYRRYELAIKFIEVLLDRFDRPVIIWYGH